MLLEICTFLSQMKEDFDNGKENFLYDEENDTVQVLVNSLFSSQNFYYYKASKKVKEFIEHIRINEYYVRTGNIIDVMLKNKLHFLLIGSPDNYLNVMINRENEKEEINFLFTYEFETFEITKINERIEDIFIDNEIKSMYHFNEDIEFYFKLKGII